MPGGTAERVIYAENDVEGKVAFGKIVLYNIYIADKRMRIKI